MEPDHQQQPERAMSFSLPVQMADHVRAQARWYGCSQAAYIRRLVAQDLEAAQRRQAS